MATGSKWRRRAYAESMQALELPKVALAYPVVNITEVSAALPLCLPLCLPLWHSVVIVSSVSLAPLVPPVPVLYSNYGSAKSGCSSELKPIPQLSLKSVDTRPVPRRVAASRPSRPRVRDHDTCCQCILLLLLLLCGAVLGTASSRTKNQRAGVRSAVYCIY